MAAPISIAYQEYRLSGGSANTDPDAALGGAMSSEKILSQSTTALSNITGVTIPYAAGNAIGNGALAFLTAGDTFTWTPNGGSAGAAVAVTEDGKYVVFGSAGYLVLDVDFSALPAGNQSDTVTIANIANETWDDVTKAESFAGDVEYRCRYVTNTHATDPFLDVVSFITTQPTPAVLAIGKDPAGVGDGVQRAVTSINRTGSTATLVTTAAHGFTTGQSVRVAGANQAEYNGVHVITVLDADEFTFSVSGSPATPATGTIVTGRGLAVTVADEGTAPAGVTFTAPTAESPDGISLGEIGAGEAAAIWERRTIPVRNTTSDTENDSMVQYQTYF
jgi:hypothetical protein